MFQLTETRTLDHPVEHFIEFIKQHAIPWKFLDYELADGGKFQYKIDDKAILLRYIPKILSKYYNKPNLIRFHAYISINYLEHNPNLRISIQNDSIAAIGIVSSLFLIPCFGIGMIVLLMNDQIDLIALLMMIFFMTILISHVVFARKNLYTTKQQFDAFMEEYHQADA